MDLKFENEMVKLNTLSFDEVQRFADIVCNYAPTDSMQLIDKEKYSKDYTVREHIERLILTSSNDYELIWRILSLPSIKTVEDAYDLYLEHVLKL